MKSMFMWEIESKSPVEVIGTFHLILDTGHHLDLFETHVPSVSRNLISLSRLDSIGYYFKFGNICQFVQIKSFHWLWYS